MDATGFARVTGLMEAMAAGDVAAAFTLEAEFAPQLRAAVRRVLSGRGTELTRAEVDELLHDVVLELHDRAAAWRPDGGALPWVWAERRIANVVDRHLGLFTDPLDHDRVAELEDRAAGGAGAGPTPIASDVEPPSMVLLERLVGRDDRVRLLCEALAAVATLRDGELFLEMLVQEWLGDRAPATSVGPRFAMSADAARQQKRRVTTRLRLLAASDERFAALADLPSVA